MICACWLAHMFSRISLLTVVATTGHLVQGLLFLESRLNLVRREASNLLRFGGKGLGGGAQERVGLGGGVRVIYLYLAAAVEEEGPSIQHIRFSSFFLFFLQLSPSGSSENGRDHMLLYSHILT